MTTIRARCPACGDVQLAPADLRVSLCSTTDDGTYEFRCPECEAAVSKAAERHVLDVLVASGVPLHVWSAPLEPAERGSGPPICYDDLLEFHFQLQSDDWLERLLGRDARHHSIAHEEQA